MEHQRQQGRSSRSLDKAALFFAACQDRTLRHDVVKQILCSMVWNYGIKKFATRCRKVDLT